MPTPIFRYDDEFGITDYDEDNDFECTYERDYAIRFNHDEELPKDKDLIIDYVEIVIYATGDHSNLTVELYLDNMLITSIPYSHYQTTVFDLKKLNISEKDRTLTFSKNIMVRFTQNGPPYLKMGIGCVSPGLPAGHIKGCLKDRNRLLPKSTYHYLTDHNKNITGLTDSQGNLTATWDYDAFGNIIHQTGSTANSNPLRFSSEYHDEDLGLIYYNYRHYNPKEGRWISRDMLSGGSDNPYAFIHNASQGIDKLGLDYRPYTNGMGCSPSSYDSFDAIGQQQREWHEKPCEQKRKEKMESLSNLISSQNIKEPDCSESPTCKKITLVIAVSDPCIEPIRYGHKGIAFENSYKDTGINTIGLRCAYWSANYPNLNDFERNVGTQSNTPTFEVKFCVCQKEYDQMLMNWYTIMMGMPLSHLWGIGGTCATDVAKVFGVNNNPFITPDDILTDIVPSLKNSCGSQRGKPAYVKLMDNAKTFKTPAEKYD